MKIFYSFSEWWRFFLSAIRGIAIGVFKVFYSIVAGIVSVFAYIVRSIASFQRREPKALLVVVILLSAVCFCWAMNFANERSMRVNAEMQRDSLSLKLDSAKQNSQIHFKSQNSDNEN